MCGQPRRNHRLSYPYVGRMLSGRCTSSVKMGHLRCCTALLGERRTGAIPPGLEEDRKLTDTSAATSIATGCSEPVPGRELHPLKSSAFSRRTVTSVTQKEQAVCRSSKQAHSDRRLLTAGLRARTTALCCRRR